jgi:UDPglucose 6-dehydrogenase
MNNKKLRICIIGPGIVGIATGKALSEIGFEIGFIGRNSDKILKLRKEGFWAHTFDNFPNHSFDFDVSIITVATPTEDGKINLNPIKSTAAYLGKWLKYQKKYHLVVVKSTVLPGTTEDIVIKTIEKLSGKKAGKDIGFCMNPEYLRAETALEDSRKPWVILIGQLDKKSGDILENIYQKFNCPIYRCSIKEAEMKKYIHNLYNANKITFFNEMRQICKRLKINADKIFKITTLSCEGMWNVNYGIKDYGPFSGFCLPKDTQAFSYWANKNNYEVALLDTVIEVNNKLQKKLKNINEKSSKQYLSSEL